ncbi:MAG: hypothetical protein F4X25_12540 [Chloroflexi bacterium]|nr:hypothetical protein [Chloroflexota bacterium]
MKASRLRRRKRLRAVVVAIARHQAEHGYAPSVRELMAAAGFSSTSHTTHWLRACEEAGLVVRAPRRARAITLTAKGRALAGERAAVEPFPAAGRRVA